MPYRLDNSENGKCVHKKNADGSLGEKIKCHESHAKALAHLRALEINVEEAAKWLKARGAVYSVEPRPTGMGGRMISYIRGPENIDIEIVGPENLTPLSKVENRALLLLAVRCGATRLIDNEMLAVEG